MAGLCILGDITFRINPDLIDWQFQVHTNVVPTLGGRVVQVLGASLSDIVIHGYYGENRAAHVARHNADEGSPGRSWQLAESFSAEIHRLMRKQAPFPGGATGYRKPIPIRWFYPAKGWDFLVYVKALKDGRGDQVVNHQTGKFSYDYQLTLFPVKDNTYSMTGDVTTLKTARSAAVKQAISRISHGVGWKETKFNDPLLTSVLHGDANDGDPATPAVSNNPRTGPASAPGQRRTDF
jgi:hypothetical protein